jgi:hypothetical protein
MDASEYYSDESSACLSSRILSVYLSLTLFACIFAECTLLTAFTFLRRISNTPAFFLPPMKAEPPARYA